MPLMIVGEELIIDVFLIISVPLKLGRIKN